RSMRLAMVRRRTLAGPRITDLFVLWLNAFARYVVDGAKELDNANNLCSRYVRAREIHIVEDPEGLVQDSLISSSLQSSIKNRPDLNDAFNLENLSALAMLIKPSNAGRLPGI